MYLSPADIRQTRLTTLDTLHAASRVWVEATEKLAELTLRAGRQALTDGGEHLAHLAESHEPDLDALPERIAGWRAGSAELVREAIEILGDAHQGIVQAARDQIAAHGALLMRQMDRATLSADATGEAAIDQLRGAIRQAETGFNELADAAVHGTELVEEQVRQLSDALSSESDAAAPAPRSRRRAATGE